MTDNKFFRSVSNTLWGEDPEYTDNSYSRHFVHKTWHDVHNTAQDKKRSEFHKAEMERIKEKEKKEKSNK